MDDPNDVVARLRWSIEDLIQCIIDAVPNTENRSNEMKEAIHDARALLKVYRQYDYQPVDIPDPDDSFMYSNFLF